MVGHGAVRYARILLLVLVSIAGPVAVAETYIVPIWASNLHGSDGSWCAQATATNPNNIPVSFRVARVFPMQTSDCAECGGESLPVTLEPFASRVIHPPAGVAGRRLVAGAFEVTSSGPLNIHLVAYRPGSSDHLEQSAVVLIAA